MILLFSVVAYAQSQQLLEAFLSAQGSSESQAPTSASTTVKVSNPQSTAECFSNVQTSIPLAFEGLHTKDGR